MTSQPFQPVITAFPAAACVLIAALFAVTAVHLFVCCGGKEWVRRLTKVLLVPIVCCIHIAASGGSPNALVLIALAFGWIGDILLIPPKLGVMFGTGGASFLVGHIFYISAAFGLGLPQAAYNRFGPVSAAAALVIAIGVCAAACAVLCPGIPTKLRVPLVVYAAALSLMAGVMVYSFIGSPSAPSALTAAGGVLFAVSDFILGAGISGVIKGRGRSRWLMLTYVLAQLGLALGFALL